ncbi:MAG: LiaI-LiaF-like domain-containing protein [Terracidiphilus sp.]
MNRYVMIRRLRGPAILLLIGVLALLHQMGVVSHFWRLFWPLLFIMIGVIMLAERAALATDGGYPPPVSGPADPGPTAPGQIVPSADTGIPSYPGQPAAQLPSPLGDYKDPFERKS